LGAWVAAPNALYTEPETFKRTVELDSL